MASLKVKFRTSVSSETEGVLYYQIIHKRVVRQITTQYVIARTEWNPCEEIIIKDQMDDSRKNYLMSVKYKIRSDKQRFCRIIAKLSTTIMNFTVDDILTEFRKQSVNGSLFTFTESLITQYQRQGQIRTSETYITTLNSLKRFRNQCDIELVDIDDQLVLSYEQYLKTEGVSHNTISFYMHRLQSIYNRAVEQELIEQHYPFKHLKIGIEKTLKRAIPIKYIRRLKSLEMKWLSSEDFARDMFLFSFYTRGMSFIDIAYLRKKDLKDGMLTYHRKKTEQKLYIRWESCMQHIVDKYKAKDDSPYLLSIIDNQKENHRKQYHSALSLINRHLKKLGKDIGVEIPLTMYVARHSWATIAHQEGVPISVISEGMGHGNEKTTQIYLASIENKVIDKANQKILKLI